MAEVEWWWCGGGRVVEMDAVVGSLGRGRTRESVGCGFPNVTNPVRWGGRGWQWTWEEVTAVVGERNGQGQDG